MTEIDLAATFPGPDPTIHHVDPVQSGLSPTGKTDQMAAVISDSGSKKMPQWTIPVLPGAWPRLSADRSTESLSGSSQSTESASSASTDPETTPRIQEHLGPDTNPETNGTCGICGEICQVTDDPINASKLPSTSSAVMPFGIALTCQPHHKYCLECIKQYVTVELERGREGNVVFPIRCPECSWGEWEMPDDVAAKVLETDLFERWHFQKLFEATAKYYCPNPYCSALLEVNDESEAKSKKAQCPSCRKRLCVPCRSLDHEGTSCSKNLRVQRRKGNENAAFKLARQRGWRRCPKCEIIVERISGCDHMTCKCRHSFCYRCGSDWTYKCSRQWRCKLRLAEADLFRAELFQKTKDIILGPIEDSKSSILKIKRRMTPTSKSDKESIMRQRCTENSTTNCCAPETPKLSS